MTNKASGRDCYRKVVARSRFRLGEKYRSSSPGRAVLAFEFHGIATRGSARKEFISAARRFIAPRTISIDVMINGLPNSSQATTFNMSYLPVKCSIALVRLQPVLQPAKRIRRGLRRGG